MNNQTTFALGLGMGTMDSEKNWLEVLFPQPQLHPEQDTVQRLCKLLDWKEQQEWALLDAEQLRSALSVMELPHDPWLKSKAPVVLVILKQDSQCQSTPAVYLKLHLLSHRLCAPNSINLEGIFSLLPTVSWTNQGAISMQDINQRILAAKAENNPLKIYSVDKFPQLTDYLVPTGVRIADGARVRLGAWIGEGTTIMHEGFINFNAGTAGPNMIEGRISAGVVVGADSDLGGGSSTMGTLSGGNQVLISVGKHCLIGANAGTGIPLGDGCTIEAGLYLTAGSIVHLIDSKGKPGKTCKARDLAGKDYLLFRRNSSNGTIEALENKRAIELNEALHSNN